MDRKFAMSQERAAGPSQRQLRVGEELRHALAWIIERGELRDPALHGVALTVTEATVTPDLRHASFYVTRLGGGADPAMLDALGRARSYLKRELARHVRLRFMPEIDFRFDDRFERAERIDRLLRGADGEPGRPEGESDDGS